MRRLLHAGLVALLLWPVPARAFLGFGDTALVEDPWNLIQNMTTAYHAVAQVANSAQQVINDGIRIKQGIEQLANQVRMLQHLPAHLNLLETLTFYGSQTESLLNQATSLSFQASMVTRQFDGLYRRASLVTTDAGRLTLYREMLAHQTEASAFAIQTQAIRTNLSDIYARLTDLLAGQSLVTGSVSAQQLQAQQTALATHASQNHQVLLAANFRMQAQQQAQVAAIQQMDVDAAQQHTQWRSLGSWQEAPPLAMEQRGSWR